MRTVGVIAEYNPLHTGHAYHLAEARRQAKADYVAVAMSPDFVQRGEPALFDKYARAEMALLAGADLVLELPLCCATGSAEYFAGGAVSLLHGLGVVDALSFGCETPDAALFWRTASVLSEEPELCREMLKDGLRRGLAFPRAREEALFAYFREERPAESCPLPGFLRTPNNILGLEYCKALLRLNSPMEILPVKREGSNYGSTSLEGAFCSAAALRREIRRLTMRGSLARPMNNSPEPAPGPFDSFADPSSGPCAQKADAQAGSDIERLLSYIPEDCRSLFLGCCVPEPGNFLDALLPLLYEKLLSTEDFGEYLDFSGGLGERARRLRFSCIGKSWEEIVALLKSRQFTEARIRRALLHLVLGIRKQEAEAFRAEGPVFYARVLGFRKSAAPLLAEIKKRSPLPLLTRPAQASSLLTGTARSMWEQDVYASHLYRALLQKSAAPFRTEQEHSPVIL